MDPPRSANCLCYDSPDLDDMNAKDYAIMGTSVRVDTFRDQPAFVLESDHVRLVVLPGISGKIVSLIDLATGDDLLWQNPDREYREQTYGDSFSAYDMSGWEDCLPTISACPYPEWPWDGVQLPDHGEVWAIPWHARIDGDALELSVNGVRLPYRFEKRVAVIDGVVHVTHRIFNPTPFPMRYVWATHPLFAVRPGMRVVLPEPVRVRINATAGSRLGSYLEELPWPVTTDANGKDVDLSLIGSPDSGLADKLFTTEISEGWCGLYDPMNRRAIALTFDPEQLPYVGVWLNHGGYPADGAAGYNVGLEPSSGYPDALDVAVERGSASTVDPGEQREWTVQLRFGEANSVQDLLGANPIHYAHRGRVK